MDFPEAFDVDLRSGEFLPLLHARALRVLKSGRALFFPQTCRARNRLIVARSWPPVSKRKDDCVLHVDAFPSLPIDRRGILCRFGCANAYSALRVRRPSEPFADHAVRFVPEIAHTWPGEASLLQHQGIARKRRNEYDRTVLMSLRILKPLIAQRSALVPLE